MYIHELTDWPRFRWDQATLLVLLAKVRHRQGRLVGRMETVGIELTQESVLSTLTEDVVKSSAIEGEMLDVGQVRSSMARRLGLAAGMPIPAGRDVEGVVEMMVDATQNYRHALTAERLFGWHSALFPTGRSGLRKILDGHWRTDESGTMQVVSGPMGRERVHFEAPAASRLPAEMSGFLEWFNGELSIDPVLKAALAHLWFVTLHPFDDGNGRMARAIADLALARSEQSPNRFYSMSAQIQAERDDYYSILERTQKGSVDVTGWMRWFLECLDRAFDGAEVTLAEIVRRSNFWNRHAGDPLNDRQRKILSRLLEGFEGKLTSSKWAKMAKCSQDTAHRDILELIELGILIQNPGKGRSTSYSFRE